MTDSGAQLTSTLARGTSINLFGFLFRTGLVFLHSVLAIRLFGVQAYGQYALGFAMIMLLSSVAQVGLSQTLVRFVASERIAGRQNHLRALLWLALKVSLPIALFIAAALAIWARPAATLFGDATLVTAIPVFALALPILTVMSLLSSYTQGFARMRFRTLAIDIMRPAVEVLSVITLAALDIPNSSLPLAVAYVISVFAATLTLLYFIFTSLLPERVSQRPDKPEERPYKLSHRVLRFSLRVWLLDLLTSTTQRSSFLLLGALGTSTMVGVFAILQRLNGFGIVFLISTNLIFGPLVADLSSRQETNEFERLYRLSTRWIFVISLPLFVLMAFYGRKILLIFGPEFVEGYRPFLVLIAAGIINIATGSNVTLTMAGYPHYSVINQAVNLITMASLSWWLIPSYGLLGSVIAVATGIVLANLLQTLEIWGRFQTHPYGAGFFKAVFAGLCLCLALLISQNILMHSGWLADGLTVITALGIYFAIVLVLGLSEEEQTIKRSIWLRFTGILNSKLQHPFI